MIDSKEEKVRARALESHVWLNRLKIFNAFHGSQGKYLRIVADAHHFQQAILGLPNLHPHIADSLAVHAARFELKDPNDGSRILVWTLSFHCSSGEVSLQTRFRMACPASRLYGTFYRHFVELKPGIVVRGLIHIKGQESTVLPVVHILVPQHFADVLKIRKIDFGTNQRILSLLREVVDTPHWASKLINPISETPHQHFLYNG